MPTTAPHPSIHALTTTVGNSGNFPAASGRLDLKLLLLGFHHRTKPFHAGNCLTEKPSPIKTYRRLRRVVRGRTTQRENSLHASGPSLRRLPPVCALRLCPRSNQPKLNAF